jgi:3-oxoacyl-[acyl-carrier protein] reductase
MLLEDKNALIYGAGPLGGAVARAFADEGARVFIANRTLPKAEALAATIRDAGGEAEAASVDALDQAAVDAHVDSVAAQAGSVDVSFNLISLDDVQGTPLVEMAYEAFARPIEKALRSTFTTVKAAARQMVPQGSGAVLFFGGMGDPLREHSIGGFQVALQAVESMRRQLSAELGRHGVRFVTLRTGGVPETIPADFVHGDQVAEGLVKATMLGRAATLADVGNVAAFVASDLARSMTAATVNVSCGSQID